MRQESPQATLSQHAANLDRADPLALAKDRFLLPEGKIYLDGNSLGALPKHVPKRLEDAVLRQWGQDLISSWNTNHWIDLPQKVGAQLAGLIGAQPFEVVACDSTSINVFKVLLAALKLRPERRVIVSDIDNFPTDLYIAQGISEMLGGYELRFVKRADLKTALCEDVAVLLLTEVDYRTGERLEMQTLTTCRRIDHLGFGTQRRGIFCGIESGWGGFCRGLRLQIPQWRTWRTCFFVCGRASPSPSPACFIGLDGTRCAICLHARIQCGSRHSSHDHWYAARLGFDRPTRGARVVAGI
jgi:hypothetical protein